MTLVRLINNNKYIKYNILYFYFFKIIKDKTYEIIKKSN